MGREVEKSAEEKQFEKLWAEADEKTHSLGSFEVEETLYRDIKKTAYRPAWKLNLTQGVGKKWDFLETDEINNLMESIKFSMVEGWGERYGLDFEVEAGRSIKTTETHRHFDRGEYVPEVEISSVQQNEKDEPLVDARIRYVGPTANPEGITDWTKPDYIKARISFNTSDPQYREAYEALDLVVDNVFEEYSEVSDTKWYKDTRAV